MNLGFKSAFLRGFIHSQLYQNHEYVHESGNENANVLSANLHHPNHGQKSADRSLFDPRNLHWPKCNYRLGRFSSYNPALPGDPDQPLVRCIYLSYVDYLQKARSYN